MLNFLVNFRSSGKIISINISSFEALSQVGSARVKTKNIGRLEASYSLTVCISSRNCCLTGYFVIFILFFNEFKRRNLIF